MKMSTTSFGIPPLPSMEVAQPVMSGRQRRKEAIKALCNLVILYLFSTGYHRFGSYSSIFRGVTKLPIRINT